MRSRIGTKTRLAAHLLALVLLIFMLVYVPPQVASRARGKPVQPARIEARDNVPPIRPVKPADGQELPHDPAATLDRVHTPKRTAIPAEKLRPPTPTASTPPVLPIPVTPPEAPSESTSAASVPTLPVRPPSGTAVLDDTEEAGTETIEPVITDPVENETAANGTAASTRPASVVPPSETAPDSTAADSLRPPEASPENTSEDEEPPQPQPDESGALVVAETPPERAAQLLPNASLEVLGDGVYWIDSRHNAADELAGIPEVGGLVLLTPLPGFRATGFEHLKTEVLPADPDDLTQDAAEHFLDLTTKTVRPVVVAVLPGARGAAFFKGIYFLRNRNLPLEDVIRELEPELLEAGAARDDIIHRLRRFDEAER